MKSKNKPAPKEVPLLPFSWNKKHLRKAAVIPANWPAGVPRGALVTPKENIPPPPKPAKLHLVLLCHKSRLAF